MNAFTEYIPWVISTGALVVSLVTYMWPRKTDKFERYKLQRDVLLTRLNELQETLDTLENMKVALSTNLMTDAEINKLSETEISPIKIRLQRYGLPMFSRDKTLPSPEEIMNNGTAAYSMDVGIRCLINFCFNGINQTTLQLADAENKLLDKSNQLNLSSQE